MRDEQHRPGKRLERRLERLARLEVEVVRRLVEHEEVRARRDRRSRARAAGARRPREPPPASRARPSRRRGSARAATAPRAAAGPSPTSPRRAPSRARPARPRAGRSTSPRRRGRAAPCRPPRARRPRIVSSSVVLPDPFGPTSATCSPRSIANDAPSSSVLVAGAHDELVDDEHVAAGARRLEELEAERAPARVRRLHAHRLDALDLLQLRLRLLREALLVTEPLDEPLEPRDLLSLPRGRLRLVDRARRLLAPPDVPRAREVERLAAFQLEHRRRHRLEEPAVVRDEDHRGVECLQHPLEPFERLDVEVVRRLVEQQQVGLRRERPRERRARQLAAGERRAAAGRDPRP